MTEFGDPFIPAISPCLVLSTDFDNKADIENYKKLNPKQPN